MNWREEFERRMADIERDDREAKRRIEVTYRVHLAIVAVLFFAAIALTFVRWPS